MRSAHTQRYHEPKACTSPATALYFSQNKQPQRQQGDTSNRECAQAVKGGGGWAAVQSKLHSRSAPPAPARLGATAVRYKKTRTSNDTKETPKETKETPPSPPVPPRLIYITRCRKLATPHPARGGAAGGGAAAGGVGRARAAGEKKIGFLLGSACSMTSFFSRGILR